MQPATVAERKSLLRDLFGHMIEERSISFASYFKLYDSLVNFNHAIVQVYPPALQSHDDVRRLTSELRANPQMTRKKFRDTAFPSISSDTLTLRDREFAINIAVHLVTMVDCSSAERHCAGYEVGGFKPRAWTDEVSLTDFLSAVFPKDERDQAQIQAVMKDKSAIKGWKLKKRAHITFRPTDNLAEHLLYDPRCDVVHLFHHAAFLKAHLQLSAGISMDSGFDQSLPKGFLPPQLIVETLHSLQFILFPAIDEKSSRLLLELVRDKKFDFDQDCLMYDGYVREAPERLEYHYWGDRLAVLHHLVKNPRPSYRIGQWLERHASDRNIMVVAILSLVLSAFFGFLSVVIGVVQVWVAFQSWKTP